MSSAYYTAGGSSFRPQGGASRPSSSSSSSSSSRPSSNNNTSYNNNTSAVNRNTSATNDNTKAAKKSTQVFDWVERKLIWFTDRVKSFGDNITDWITSAQKKTLLYRQVDATNDEMRANYMAAMKYREKAWSLGLDKNTRKLIEEGRFSIDDIDTSTDAGKAKYDKVQDYIKYYDAYRDCIDAVRELRAEQVELFAQWAAIPTEEAEKKINSLVQSYNGLSAIQARLDTANLGGSALAALKRQNDANMNYVRSKKETADDAFNTQKNKLDNNKKQQTTAKKTADADKKSLTNATNALKKGASLTTAEKNQIAAGKALSTKGLSGKKKSLVEKYNAALKKSSASQKTYQNTVSTGQKITEDYNKVKEQKQIYDNIYNQYKKDYNIFKGYDSENGLNSSIYTDEPWKYQNYLVDQELANLKQQNDVNVNAQRQSTRNTEEARKRVNSYKSQLTSIQNKGKSYSQKYAKYLTAEQNKQLASGQKVIGSIKDANVKKIIDQYNIQLQNAKNSYTASTQQLSAAIEAEWKAAENAAVSQAEYAQAQVEAEQTKFENIKNFYEGQVGYQEKWNAFRQEHIETGKIHGNYTSSETIDTEIKDVEKVIKYQKDAVIKLREQLKKSVASGVIKEYSDEWLEMNGQIAEAETALQNYNNQIEQLKQEQILVIYEEMFDRAIARADKFQDKIETIKSLITPEMIFDRDTGHLTEMGALSIVLNSKQLDTSLNTLKDYVKKRQQIMDDYKADKFGEKTYEELMAENDASLQSALKDAQSYQKAIIDIIVSQAEAEQEALFKVIDARKDALKKKKEYYDYDKTIKNKTKEINLLKQQIAALDGVTDAQSRAEKARLEAELAEKQEDFDDTVRDHVYELQVDGLDEMKDQLSEDLEKWSYELSANLDKMSQAISDAVANVGGNTADALNAIAKILEKFGINAGNLGITQGDLDVSDMPKYRRGAKRVGKDVLAVTNDGGREIIVTRKGIITPMKSGDGVIPNNMTETLMDMAEFWNNYNTPVYSDMFKMKDTTSNNTGTNIVNVNYDGPMLQVQGDVTKSTLPDLQTIIDKADKQIQKNIWKDLKRFRS